MRVVFIGAGATAITTAQLLVEHGHEVVIIEKDEARIREASEQLDCGYLHGDGTRPHVLKQADPQAIDTLLCLTDMDQENILASLVGRTLNIPHVVTKLEDPEFETVATALGLETVVVPVRTMGRRLADLVEGKGAPELSGVVKGEARLLSFIVQPHQAGPVQDLDLPQASQVVWLYRNGRLEFSAPELRLEPGDEVVVLTRDEIADAVRESLASVPP